MTSVYKVLILLIRIYIILFIKILKNIAKKVLVSKVVGIKLKSLTYIVDI